MQTIREGNLYFLESPFHFKPPTEESTELEKRLSYLLGTVSARPAVVIRAPSWWDKFNTVTVIPALTKGKPAITFGLKDRYGHMTQAAYPFVPHNPHTIPVSRLGRYIGSLDQEELDELLYAFQWIHDPCLQADRVNHPVPKCYEEVFGKDIPMSWKHNKDARANVDLMIDKDSLKVRSNSFPKLNGFPLGNALRDEVPDEVIQDVDFVATTNPLPDEMIESHDLDDETVFGLVRDDEPELEETTTTTSNTSEEPQFGLVSDEPVEETPPTVPVEKDFPPSTFPTAMLNEVAGRFDFSAAYYNGDMKTRDPKYLTEEETRNIRGNATNAEMDTLFDYYRTLTPMDAFVLGPRLPTEALQHITGFSRAKASTLKRLCNIMRDIEETDYQQRIEAEQVAIAQMAAEKAAKRAADKEDRKAKKEAQTSQLAMVQKYLNPDKIYSMTTEDEVNAFLALPMGVVKRAWTGLNFKDSYADAKRFYKAGMKIYDKLRTAIAESNIDITEPSLQDALNKILSGDVDL